MTPDPENLHTAVAALATEVERLSRQLADQHQAISHAQDSADHAHRVLVDIVDRVKDVADKVTTGRPEGDHPGSPSSWLTIDPDTAHTTLTDLIDWLNQVYIHYPGSAASLGECWLWHPFAVEELLALRAAWLAAYVGPQAHGTRAADWHDRHLPGVQRRLRAALGDCSLAAHRPGGRADQLTPTIPAAEAADPIAEWWATSHGTTPAPPAPNTA